MKKLIFLALLMSPTFVMARFVDFDAFPSWGETPIEVVKDAGIMTGYADGTFRSDGIINRAEALTILFRTKAMDIGDTEYVRNFLDVPRDAWFSNAVNTAIGEGWITGYEDGTFRPGNSINNAEWAILLQRAFQLEVDEDNVSSYADVPHLVWYGDPVNAMYANGLIRTERAKFFHPEAELTRASVAWTISTILRMPRLLGTSQENNFSGVKIDSRRTAYPRGSDFNPNLQGYDIERSVLRVETNVDVNPLLITLDSDWQSIGQVRLTNALTDPVEVASLELKLRFEATNVGPDRNFFIRIVGSGIDSESALDRTGAVLFGGMNGAIEAGNTLILHVKIKPDTTKYFWGRSGDGSISVEEVRSSTKATFTGDENYGRTLFKTTPVEFVDRKLTPIRFEP